MCIVCAEETAAGIVIAAAGWRLYSYKLRQAAKLLISWVFGDYQR